MSTLILLAIYTLLILIFVPLDKIAKAQTYVKNKVKQVKDKVDN
jgi:hypothetical protein